MISRRTARCLGELCQQAFRGYHSGSLNCFRSFNSSSRQREAYNFSAFNELTTRTHKGRYD